MARLIIVIETSERERQGRLRAATASLAAAAIAPAFRTPLIPSFGRRGKGPPGDPRRIEAARRRGRRR